MVDHSSVAGDVAHMRKNYDARMKIWDQLFELDRGAFRPAGDKKFHSSMSTDGISIAVHKHKPRPETPRRKTRGQSGFRRAVQDVLNEAKTPYIEDLETSFVLSKKNKAVLTDVGKIELIVLHARGLQGGRT
ncbi:unnamed protein product [Tilletia caries]|nr:unnamed protein product [Tilletia caries]